jgi:hypothetical protein
MDRYPFSSFDPNTGREFSKFPPVRGFQKLMGRIGFNALLTTLPSTEDTPRKRGVRTVARHLLAAANVPTHIDDPALLPGVIESDTHLSGAEPLERSRRLIRTGLGVAAFAATAAIMIPATVEALDHAEERMEQIHEQNNSADLLYPNTVESSPADEYQFLPPLNIQKQLGK